MTLRTPWAAAVLASVLATGTAWAGKAHEHGVVKLDVAVDGGAVTLVVEMPLDNLVGFERAPRTAAERQTATAALAKMRDGGALFRLDAAAQCKLRSADVQAPLLEAAAGTTAPDGHGDLDATYVFDCAQPARLAALDVLLFDAFKRVERVQVQAALPHGQRQAVLRSGARRVALSK